MRRRTFVHRKRKSVFAKHEKFETLDIGVDVIKHFAIKMASSATLSNLCVTEEKKITNWDRIERVPSGPHSKPSHMFTSAEISPWSSKCIPGPSQHRVCPWHERSKINHNMMMLKAEQCAPVPEQWEMIQNFEVHKFCHGRHAYFHELPAIAPAWSVDVNFEWPLRRWHWITKNERRIRDKFVENKVVHVPELL